MFRVFKAKILNAPVCTKCPVNFFRRSIIRPVNVNGMRKCVQNVLLVLNFDSTVRK